MKSISTQNVPSAIGPYSHGIISGNFIFVSGQVGRNVKGELADGIKAQTKQVCENMKSVLEAAGSSLQKVVKTTVYLQDMNEFSAMNEVYATYFPQKPARATVQVARLPGDVAVEIDCIAELK